MEEMKSPDETTPIILPQSKLARIEIMPRPARRNSPRFFTLAATRLKVLWRSVIRHATNKRKALSVRETAALGDRRFVSVIQFESQRFLIGSSPTSVTLLAQLPDQPHHEKEPDEEAREETVEECGQPGEKEKTHRESEEKN